MDRSQNAIKQALDNASIDNLQRQEAQYGFNEKPARVGHFFRKGIVGDWQQTLTPIQINRIINDHGEMMQQYGYLDAHQQPVII